MKNNVNNVQRYSTIFVLLVLCFTFFIHTNNASAQFNSLVDRYIAVSTSEPSASSIHELGFTYGAGFSVGSVRFEYCTSPIFYTTCVVPTGLDMSAASFSAQTGETGYSVFSQTTNEIVLSRTPAVTSSIASKYIFTGVINPSASNDIYYVRVSYYASNNGSGPMIERGGVASHTSENIDLTTIVPPILYFCVATSIPIDCATANGSNIQMGTLSSATASTGTSQIMAQTNADFGYSIIVNGTTMTSGNNIIAPLTVPSASAPGSAQFGINLRDNSLPDVGSEPIGVGIATPTAQYAIPNNYKFVSGDNIASSNDVSDYVKFTISYLVNVPSDQKPGVYSTTLTYTIVATF